MSQTCRALAKPLDPTRPSKLPLSHISRNSFQNQTLTGIFGFEKFRSKSDPLPRNLHMKSVPLPRSVRLPASTPSIPYTFALRLAALRSGATAAVIISLLFSVTRSRALWRPGWRAMLIQSPRGTPCSAAHERPARGSWEIFPVTFSTGKFTGKYWKILAFPISFSSLSSFSIPPPGRCANR